MAGVVKIDLTAVRRSWLRGGREFWMQLRTRNGTDAAFFQAVNEANEHEEDGNAIASFATRSPHGFVTMVKDILDDEHLLSWLTDFAARLERLGFDGTLQGVTPARVPERSTRRGRGAFIAWSINTATMTVNPATSYGQVYQPGNPAANSGWFVPAEPTAKICHHAATWTEPGGPRIVIRRDLFKFAVSEGSDIAGILASAITRTGMAGLYRFEARGEHWRSADLSFGGDTIMMIHGGPTTWQERIGELRRAITTLPELADQAFIGPTATGSASWLDLDVVQRLDGMRASDVTYNRHLLPHYVPDAHGIQVVRDEHLTHAHDLTNWNITPLGHGRHLLEAPDLTPWYNNPDLLPDPDTLTQARHDFGPMILTKNTITANPPPWK
jgi:hypothetical protein